MDVACSHCEILSSQGNRFSPHTKTWFGTESWPECCPTKSLSCNGGLTLDTHGCGVPQRQFRASHGFWTRWTLSPSQTWGKFSYATDVSFKLFLCCIQRRNRLAFVLNLQIINEISQFCNSSNHLSSLFSPSFSFPYLNIFDYQTLLISKMN